MSKIKGKEKIKLVRTYTGFHVPDCPWANLNSLSNMVGMKKCGCDFVNIHNGFEIIESNDTI